MGLVQLLFRHKTIIDRALEEDIGAVEVSIDLDPDSGTYTFPNLASILEASLNASSPNGYNYSVIYDENINKFSIRSSGLFKLKFGTGIHQEVIPVLLA